MLKVLWTELRVHELSARMPFRYGITTMTHLPHLMLRADVEIDGKIHHGQSAENLAPKWFTKDPNTSPQHDIEQMLRVVRCACRIAVEIGEQPSLFDWWRELYRSQEIACGANDPALLWGLGVSLVERAGIDAFCRAKGVTFATALRENRFKIDLGQVYPELRGAAPAEMLPREPPRKLIVRHTVGLSDPLTDEQIPTDQLLRDGLPQSLQACIQTYGLTHFKIKLAGQSGADVDRLREIASLLHCSGDRYAFTLDGNENFGSAESFKEFWNQVMDEPQLQEFLSRLIFVEQPLHRDVALATETGCQLTGWRDRPDMIIDESGGSIEAIPEALDSGYAGASHKNCKGVFKGIAAACLIEQRRRRGHPRLILSAEDLSNTGPIALHQDIAVVASLGLEHAERNGHHYFRGLDAWPKDIRQKLLAEHPSLYTRRSAADDLVTLRIESGRVDLASILAAPFGANFQIGLEQFTPAN